jgi:hypothetical protein
MEIKQAAVTQPIINTPPTITPVIEAVVPDVIKPSEKAPCNWNIVDNGGSVTATNSQTGRVFNGELSEFVAKFLR